MFLYDTASKHHGQYIYMRILETASFPAITARYVNIIRTFHVVI